MRYLLLFIWLLTIQLLSAQDDEPELLRLEIPALIDLEIFHVEPMGSNGVLIFYESNEISEEGERKWYFAMFNKNLEELWLKFVALKDRISFRKSSQLNDKSYYYFQSVSKNRDGNSYFQILELDRQTTDFSVITGIIPDKSEFIDVAFSNQHAIVALSSKRNEHDLIRVNLSDGEINQFDFPENTEIIIDQLLFNQKADRFFLLGKSTDTKKIRGNILAYFNSDGAFDGMQDILIDPDKMFINRLSIYATSNRNWVIIGDYSQTVNEVDLKDYMNEEMDRSTGLFYLQLSDQLLVREKLYPFGELSNLFGPIRSREMYRAQMRNTRGGSFNSSGIDFSLHGNDLLKLDTQLVFIAEAYYPEYRTETRMDYDFYGRPIPYTYSVFAGNNFFSTILVAFDNQGNILWNNDMEIRDLKSFDLKPHVLAIPDGQEIVLAYSNNGRVYSKIIEGNIVTGPTEQNAIETLYLADRLRKSENSRILHWYKNYYLAYGYDQIRNESGIQQPNRSVFYMNKLAFE